MKAISAKITRGIVFGSRITTCDNSGAKILKVFTIVGHKTVKGRISAGGVGDLVMASVVSGKPEIRKQVVFAVIVRQKKEYRRPNGMRIKFEDNAAVVVKDEKGDPKGTIFKGPIAKEACDRWPGIAKLSSIIV